jgi:hypothetical protein
MVVVATCAWHHHVVDREKAMTELLEAVADLRAQPERLARVGAALYEALQAGERQKDLVAATGYTRESIRRLVEDEKIRRGEIAPTKRYLDAQERARRPQP